jgi:D-cysteine desulfhydrase
VTGTIPLLQQFPGLRLIPRVQLGTFPTAVEPTPDPLLWVKRDDLSASSLGGNKVRALEFLLGAVRAGDRIATIGALASTHGAACAFHARSLGAGCSVCLWPQVMNPTAEQMAEALGGLAERRVVPSPALAMAWLIWRRVAGDRVVPAGGTAARGILGHVNAALELAGQVRDGLLPEPDRIVLPLGTGGTAAGLALGCRIAGLRTRVVAVRVVPRVVGRRGRVVRLARATARFMRRVSRSVVPDVDPEMIEVESRYYGGDYGRETPEAREAMRRGRDAGLRLDETYSAKAYAALGDHRGGVTLFWLTFDGRFIA